MVKIERESKKRIEDAESIDNLCDILIAENITVHESGHIGGEKILDANEMIRRIKELRDDPKLSSKSALVWTILRFMDEVPYLMETLEKLFASEEK